MTGSGVLTENVVAFVIQALLAGRIDRDTACRLVSAWVEGDAPSSARAEEGAQLLHGFDIVLGDEGRQYHASAFDRGHARVYVVAQADMDVRCRAWLERYDQDQGD